MPVRVTLEFTRLPHALKSLADFESSYGPAERVETADSIIATWDNIEGREMLYSAVDILRVFTTIISMKAENVY